MRKIDTSKWENFIVGEWFDVTRPPARKQNDYMAGNVRFVASGCFNNGVQAYLKPRNENDIDEGKCITISPVDGYAFWQDVDFLGRGGAGSSIIIVRSNKLNRYNALFLATVFRHVFANWKYNAMGNKDIVKSAAVFLPATPTHSPDFKAMEEYIKLRERTVKSAVDALQSIFSK